MIKKYFQFFIFILSQQYVLAHTENNPTKNMEAWAILCIYLKPLDTHEESHELLNLSKNKIITWHKYAEVPLTQLAKDRVHAIAEKENIESTLTILNWRGEHILDYDSQIAGVPLEENNDDDEDYQYEHEDDIAYNSDEYESEYESEYEETNSDNDNEQLDNNEHDNPELLETINQTTGVTNNNNYETETDNLPIIETVEEEQEQEKETKDEEPEPEPTLWQSQQQRKPVVRFAPTIQGQQHEEVSYLIKQMKQ